MDAARRVTSPKIPHLFHTVLQEILFRGSRTRGLKTMGELSVERTADVNIRREAVPIGNRHTFRSAARLSRHDSPMPGKPSE